ncbi:DUF6220 domain-containing protein [Haloactinopolyspora sp.]|uniref:DUF6220 domain-containing protein n=1 Tax=Haloactinopolyspora sp. TaxID=1966353 RepID=UPI002606C631|nr:DUF6220 domain-containing protein [Haloactinopolyspora sp.]
MSDPADTRTDTRLDDTHRISRVRTAALAVFRVLAFVTLAAVVVQIAFAGLGAFGASFDPHRDLGTAIGALILLLLVVMLVARSSRTAVLLTALLVVLGIVQFAFARLGDDTDAWFGALHAVNALAIMGVTARLATSARGAVYRRVARR